MENKDKKALIIFYAVTMTISIAVMVVSVILKSTNIIGLAMWIPGIVGIICAKVFYPKQQVLGIAVKFKFKYVLYGILIPILYLVPSYLVAWAALGNKNADPSLIIQAIAGGDVNFTSPWLAAIALSPVVFVAGAMTAAGEEIGWRGFAYPMLERLYGPRKACLINCSIWALWHFPIIIGGIYQAQVNLVYGMISFFIMVLLIGTIFCWTRSVSGSVIPAILLHSVHNAVDQIYLQPLNSNEKVPYLAGEQGVITIVLAAIILAVVIISWRKTVNKGAAN